MGKNKPARKKVESPFAGNLKILMRDRVLNAKAIATLADVSPSVVQDWLTGAVPHDLGKIANLSVKLNTDFMWLLTGQQGQVDTKGLSLEQIFDIEHDSSFSGIFMLEAKRLRRKGKV